MMIGQEEIAAPPAPFEWDPNAPDDDASTQALIAPPNVAGAAARK
jgi:hypothetical protein